MIAGIAARSIDARALVPALRDAHWHAWELLADFTPAQWTVPYHAGINPPLWELAHMIWFTEWWTLRRPIDGVASSPSRLPGADLLLDSSKIEHRDRWTASMPSLATIRSYLSDVLDAVEAKLTVAAKADLYMYRLALFHADMHGEALTYLRQTLDLPLSKIPWHGAPQASAGIFRCAGGVLEPAPPTSAAFAFDNECPAPSLAVAPFSMTRQCVTYGEFAGFVDDGGYLDERFWSEAGWRWRVESGLVAPLRWRSAPDGPSVWEERWFGVWRKLVAALPVCHVNAYEAEAYCAWANLRLPTESEWQWAVTAGEIAWGDSVWERTSDVFAPYAGFVPGPYREYSAPWFGSHRVLRGGAFATHSRMQHPRYRNFYLPDRNDVFAGFRTCLR